MGKMTFKFMLMMFLMFFILIPRNEFIFIYETKSNSSSQMELLEASCPPWSVEYKLLFVREVKCHACAMSILGSGILFCLEFAGNRQIRQ